ncbi:MAG: N-methyl-D-aspartate receptor NMDAR2C subunit [Candidatus Brennerbacteria bacterium]|nr:N-methyl-D-aspartate receptor NMDAR2C subunit [Candidatus Brennerbacteria bacterium]
MRNKNEQQWLALWKRLGAKGDACTIYNDLVARYSETHRAYHTLEHIRHCFDEFEQVRYLAMNPDAIELALWYHDIVYDTHAKDNEEKSAGLAVAVLIQSSMPRDFVRYVMNLILATKHIEIPVDIDTQLIVDIDLSSLGLPNQEFDRNSRNIRKEYQWVADDLFIAGRSAMLKSFLKRSNIYSTQFFRDKYEAQARRNIIRSLA